MEGSISSRFQSKLATPVGSITSRTNWLTSTSPLKIQEAASCAVTGRYGVHWQKRTVA
jgi:hypothetical protein